MTLLIPGVCNKEQLDRIENLLIEIYSRLGIECARMQILEQESIKQSLVGICEWEHIRIPQSQSGDLNLILLINVNNEPLLYYPQYRRKCNEISIESFLQGLLKGEITSLASREKNTVLSKELAHYL